MPESPFLSVIRIWAAMAWADGVVTPAEAAALRRLIASAELTDVEKVTAGAFIDARVILDTSNVGALSDDARRGIYRAACRMAAVDREVAATERTLLVKLRDGLGIAEPAAREIELAILGPAPG